MDLTRANPAVRRSGGTRPRDRRQQLAAIAAELFHRDGYHNVGVGDIAAAAGITGPAVYRHFASKQAILGHVVLCGLDSFAAAVQATLGEGASTAAAGAGSDGAGSDGAGSDGAGSDGAGQRLAAVAAAIAHLVVQRRELGALWRREVRNLSAADRAELAVRARGATRVGVGLLRQVRPELPEADADLLCWAALSVYGSVSEHRSRPPRHVLQAQLAALALAVVHSDPGAVGLGAGGLGAGGLGAGNTSSTEVTRREQLLTLAARMFCEHGFHAVTMEGIGAAAGISGPSIYRHYASKADLLVAMCARVGEALRDGVRAALRHPPPQALRELAASFVDTVLRYHDLVAAFLMEGHNLPGRDRAELHRLQRGYLAEWVAVLITIDPALDERSARVRVHAAFTVVNDLARTSRFAARPRLAAELGHLALTVLEPPPVSTSPK